MDQAACYDDALLRLLFDAGFMRLRIPEAYGGLGADAVTMCLVLEEAVSICFCGHPVDRLCACATGQDHAAHQLCAGHVFWRMINDQVLSFALTEPEAGSDPAACVPSAPCRPQRDIVYRATSVSSPTLPVPSCLSCLLPRSPERRGRGISAF